MLMVCCRSSSRHWTLLSRSDESGHNNVPCDCSVGSSLYSPRCWGAWWTVCSTVCVWPIAGPLMKPPLTSWVMVSRPVLAIVPAESSWRGFISGSLFLMSFLPVSSSWHWKCKGFLPSLPNLKLTLIFWVVGICLLCETYKITYRGNLAVPVRLRKRASTHWLKLLHSVSLTCL